MRLSRRTAPLLATIMLVGCGGGQKTGQREASGAALFRSFCTSCHSIAGVGSRAPSGGELDHYHLTQAQVAGLTRVMPTARHLSEREVETVAAYVAAVEARR